MRDLISSGQEPSGLSEQQTLDPRQRAWLEVSPAAIESNVRALRRLLKPTCALMAVVKADGYGHGATTVARAAVQGELRNWESPLSRKGSTCAAPAWNNRSLCWAISPSRMTCAPVFSGS